jgi:putative methyltransferase
LADSVIRCLPGEDNTNGFFVACFVRGDAQSNWSAKTRKQTKRKRGRAEDGDEKDQLDEGTPIEKGEGDDEERAGSKAARRQQQEKAGGDGEQAEAEGGKAKTAAQAERARRKRVAQKAKRKKLAEE